MRFRRSEVLALDYPESWPGGHGAEPHCETSFPTQPAAWKHAAMFGEETRSHHKQFLFRRTGWRIPALAPTAD